jgi:hypothetical protein
MRAAAVDLLTDYAATAGVRLQVYPGRPASLYPPSAFPDKITEQIDYMAASYVRQRTCRVEMLVVFGLFDSKEAVDQKDAFVDGFLDWCSDNVHAAGANTTIGLVSVEDEPAWTPDWNPANLKGALGIYYATRLTLEGFAGG